MAIDYIVDYGSVPKETLGTQGIIDRMKGRARAEAIIQLFREHGDERSPAQMGFEMTRNTAQGEEETSVMIVQDLLDQAAELEPLEIHCATCPANAQGQAFGCIHFIQYPISAQAEVWLLNLLPGVDIPLPWLLLRQSVTEMGYDGKSVEPLRNNGIYFEDQRAIGRGLGEFQVTNNQIFEMMFMLGHIQPAHAGVLLLFFNAIAREDLEAVQITEILNRALPSDELRARYPFQMVEEPGDDQSIREFKQFFKALHAAWSLNVRLLLDV